MQGKINIAQLLFARLPHSSDRSLLISVSHDGHVIAWDWLRALMASDGRVDPLIVFDAEVGPILSADLIQLNELDVCVVPGLA
jgi:hypothetical protein